VPTARAVTPAAPAVTLAARAVTPAAPAVTLAVRAVTPAAQASPPEAGSPPAAVTGVPPSAGVAESLTLRQAVLRLFEKEPGISPQPPDIRPLPRKLPAAVKEPNRQR